MEWLIDPVSGNPVRTDRALNSVFHGRAYYRWSLLLRARG